MSRGEVSGDPSNNDYSSDHSSNLSLSTTPATTLATSLMVSASPDQVISEGPGYHGDAGGDCPGRSALQLHHRLPDILLQESRVAARLLAVDVNSDCILYLTGHI